MIFIGKKIQMIKLKQEAGFLMENSAQFHGIDEEAKQIEVVFDDEKTAWYGYSELEELEHSYAITIHKSQRKRI